MAGSVDFAEVSCIDSRSVGGHALTLDDLTELADQVRHASQARADGVVITQGTDTIEETAYAIALLVDTAIPVVITGAMRAPQDAGADGPANLQAALRVASDPRAAGLGPLVVIQDEVHAARTVVKLHTGRVAAFGSPGRGPIGSVMEGRVALHPCSAPSDFLGQPDRLTRRVELVWTAVGCDGTAVESAASYCEGIVVAALGGGNVPPAVVPSLARAVESGVAVVLASRCAAGPVLTRSYGGPGTDGDLRAIGVVPAGELSAIKARLRLLVALELGMRAHEAFPVG